MSQGGLILAASRARSKKKTRNNGQFFNSGAYKKGKKKRNKNIFLVLSTPVAVSYSFFFTFFPGEVPSATTQSRALQMDLRHVNERNQKVLSRAIQRIF